MLNRLKESVAANKKEMAEIKLYFERCAYEIDRSNLYMLRKVCMYASVVFICMLLFGYMLVPGFKINPGHILFVPFMTVFFLINIYTSNNQDIPRNRARLICMSFYFLLGIDLVIIEICSNSSRHDVWFILAVMAYPVLYIDRLYRYGFQLTVACTFYCLLIFMFMGREYALITTYYVIGAYTLSQIIGRMILGVRSKQGLSMADLKRFGALDKLTQVYNKGALIQEINAYLMRKGQEDVCAMCIIDVDNFKTVNDSLGHSGGDLLLHEIGKLLNENFRPSDIIGRFGGDEFVVFMPNMSDSRLIELRCRTMQMILADFNIGNSEPFSLSIGVVVDEGNHSQEDIFRMADDALYKSKMEGKNKVTAWVSHENIEFEKPVYVMVFTEDFGEKYKNAVQMERERFELFTTESDDIAVQYISQYMEKIAIVAVELDAEKSVGEALIRYLKGRERFRSIPLMVVVRSDAEAELARECGADEVRMTTDPPERFRECVNRLTKHLT